MATNGKVEIPVIDLAVSHVQNGRDLVEAVATYGFVFVKNHGTEILPQEIENIFSVSRDFFKSSKEDKAKCEIGVNNRGWSSMHKETLDPEHQLKGDFKEAFNFGEFENGKAQQPLSSVLTEHEAELDHFFGRCQKLCAKILRLFALGLEIDHQGGGEDWFSSKHDPAKGPSGSVLRLLYYPALAPSMEHDPSADLRAGAHSDYGSITLLFQRPGQPGLEIQNPSSEWSPVPVSPAGTEDDAVPPILVNIGDLLSYWTNGLFKSTVHRVIFPKEGRKGGQDRYSIAYFCHPLNTTELVPVPSPKVSVRREGSAGEDGRAMTAEEHLNRRLAATYGWVKDEEGGVGVEMMHTSGRS